jgi:hypothetical protein
MMTILHTLALVVAVVLPVVLVESRRRWALVALLALATLAGSAALFANTAYRAFGVTCLWMSVAALGEALERSRKRESQG